MFKVWVKAEFVFKKFVQTLAVNALHAIFCKFYIKIYKYQFLLAHSSGSAGRSCGVGFRPASRGPVEGGDVAVLHEVLNVLQVLFGEVVAAAHVIEFLELNYFSGARYPSPRVILRKRRGANAQIFDFRVWGAVLCLGLSSSP